MSGLLNRMLGKSMMKSLGNASHVNNRITYENYSVTLGDAVDVSNMQDLKKYAVDQNPIFRNLFQSGVNKLGGIYKHLDIYYDDKNYIFVKKDNTLVANFFIDFLSKDGKKSVGESAMLSFINDMSTFETSTIATILYGYNKDMCLQYVSNFANSRKIIDEQKKLKIFKKENN